MGALMSQQEKSPSREDMMRRFNASFALISEIAKNPSDPNTPFDEDMTELRMREINILQRPSSENMCKELKVKTYAKN